MVLTWVRVGCGLALGVLTALGELVWLVLSVPVLLAGLVSPGAARLAGRGARGLAELERLRLAYFMGSDNSRDYTGERALAYVAVRIPLGGILLMLRVYGAGTGGLLIHAVGVGPGGRWHRAEHIQHRLPCHRRCGAVVPGDHGHRGCGSAGSRARPPFLGPMGGPTTITAALPCA